MFTFVLYMFGITIVIGILPYCLTQPYTTESDWYIIRVVQSALIKFKIAIERGLEIKTFIMLFLGQIKVSHPRHCLSTLCLKHQGKIKGIVQSTVLNANLGQKGFYCLPQVDKIFKVHNITKSTLLKALILILLEQSSVLVKVYEEVNKDN